VSYLIKGLLLLKLAPGNRNNTNGTLNNRGNNGNYWSSTENGTNANNLNFNSSNANTNMNTNNNNRKNSFSMRCVLAFNTNLYYYYYYKTTMPTEPNLLIDLFKAYYQARKNKRNTSNQLEFEINYELNLMQLHTDIVNGVYTVSTSICFVVNKPVKREIFAAHFRDRVVHHLLYNYSNPTFEKQFIEDSYSCRKGKGTHFGIKRLNEAIQTFSDRYKKECYVLKLDIQGYFMSINKNVLQQKLITGINHTKEIPKETKKVCHYLIDKIINDNPTNNCFIKGKRTDWQNLAMSKSLFGSKPYCGLPIGNLTSQLFSNIYLHSFDVFMKKEQAIKQYGRYVDDFYVVHQNPEYLKEVIEIAKQYLHTDLGLIVHPKKIVLQNYTKGVNFLGATIKPHRIYISNRTKINFKRCVNKWKLVVQHTIPSMTVLHKIRASVNSYLGMLRHYSTYNIRYNVLLKDRNNKLFTCGYVEWIKNTKMIYRLNKLKTNPI
jgi:RNA-directed DNA polymerase